MKKQALTGAERSKKLRDKRLDDGLFEVRGVYTTKTLTKEQKLLVRDFIEDSF